MEKKIEIALENAKRKNERRMFVLAGEIEKSKELLKKIFLKYKKTCEKNIEICFVLHTKENKKVKEIEKIFEKENIKTFEYKKSEFLLGTSWDVLILDLTQGIMPNDLGKLISIVRGNGIIFLIMPSLNKFENMFTKFHKKILVPPFEEKDLRFVFNKWFLRKLKEYKGIYIFEEGKLVFYKEEKLKSKKVAKEKLLPKDTYFPREVYEICKTQDQIYALKSLEEFFRKNEKVFVLTSHRGRGKSSLLGIALASILLKENLRIVLTSPQKTNVNEVFKFFKKTLERFGKEKKIEYVKPIEIKNVKADIIVIDEAAAIPVNLLFSALKRARKVVYSTTIHGYEGCGRSFNIRFLKELEEKKERIVKVEMREPIRYSEEDCIEKWLFDVLLLDAEPPSIKEFEVNLEKSIFRELEIKKLVFEDEKKLREFFGIFVTAHYRNNPNDFGIICEAPHHKIFSLENEKGKVICSLQVALEGNLKEEHCKKMLKIEEFSGHLIPDRFIKHYRLKDFGKLKGLRIIRIATHPLLMRKGIGSKALNELEKYVKEKGYNWIGASFGVSFSLLKFWLKNGFKVFHISPAKNPQTGEYSVIVLKGISGKGKEYAKIFEKEFLIKFAESLSYPYNVLETEIARLVLTSLEGFGYKPRLTEIQIKRIQAYLEEVLTFETCRDAIYEIAKAYFFNKNRILEEKEELILIAKCLQGKPWKVARDIANLDTSLEAIEVLRKSIDKIKNKVL